LTNRKAGKPDDWLSSIGGFLTGELSESDFLKRAADSDKEQDAVQHCEAFFYAGMKRLIAGDQRPARDDLQKCLATEVKDSLEYQSAAVKLRRLQ
jgi:lipoprotein NlpI